MLQDLTKYLDKRQDKPSKLLACSSGLSIYSVRQRPRKLVELQLEIVGVAHVAVSAKLYSGSGPTSWASASAVTPATASRYAASASRRTRWTNTTPRDLGSSSTRSANTTGPSASRTASSFTRAVRPWSCRRYAVPGEA